MNNHEYLDELCPICSQPLYAHGFMFSSATEPAENICPDGSDEEIIDATDTYDETWAAYDDNHGIDRWRRHNGQNNHNHTERCMSGRALVGSWLC